MEQSDILLSETIMDASGTDFINQAPKQKTSSGPSLGSFFESNATKVRPSLNDFKKELNRSIRCDGSVSELSFSVNDSARGLRFDQVYHKKEVLGEGGFAVVYRCIHKNRRHSYAVKEVHNENYETSGENIIEEIDALKRLRDVPYIVRLLDVFRGPEATHLVMEQMKGGDLLARLEEKVVFSETESRKISRKLIEAMVYCHKKCIAHRDIKLENILLSDRMDDTKIKLADFGCARKFIPGEDSLKSLCGSPQYAAPELYMHENGYNERCDIWSIGVVIFILLGGYAPFEGSGMELPRIICEGFFDFPAIYWGEISREAKRLIKSLLVVDPDDRATLVDALDSEWLRRRDRESFYKTAQDDGSSVFEAWVKFQKETSLSKLKQSEHSTNEPSHSELTEEGHDSSEPGSSSIPSDDEEDSEEHESESH